MSQEKDEVAEEPAEQEVQTKKRKKRQNLRVGHTPEERRYMDNTDLLLLAARKASLDLSQKEAVLREKDAKRKHMQEVAEQVKKEKRQARFERSQARKNKLKEAASATLEEKKKAKAKSKQ